THFNVFKSDIRMGYDIFYISKNIRTPIKTYQAKLHTMAFGNAIQGIYQSFIVIRDKAETIYGIGLTNNLIVHIASLVKELFRIGILLQINIVVLVVRKSIVPQIRGFFLPKIPLVEA